MKPLILASSDVEQNNKYGSKYKSEKQNWFVSYCMHLLS